MRLSAQQQWSIATVLLVSVAGCALSGSNAEGGGIQPVQFASATATIATIKQPSNVNAIVQVKGRVGNRAPLLGKTAYELQDATGSVWVVTTSAVPNPGDEVLIKGKLLYQSILINGKEQGSTYIEQQQLQRTSALKSSVEGVKAKGLQIMS